MTLLDVQEEVPRENIDGQILQFVTQQKNSLILTIDFAAEREPEKYYSAGPLLEEGIQGLVVRLRTAGGIIGYSI